MEQHDDTLRAGLKCKKRCGLIGAHVKLSLKEMKTLFAIAGPYYNFQDAESSFESEKHDENDDDDDEGAQDSNETDGDDDTSDGKQDGRNEPDDFHKTDELGKLNALQDASNKPETSRISDDHMSNYLARLGHGYCMSRS